MRFTWHHRGSRGYVILVALVFMAIFLGIAAAFVNYLTSYARVSRYAVASAQALAIAEGGIDHAVYELDTNAAYAGETGTPLGNGVFTTTVTNIDLNTKSVAVTASVPNETNPIATRTVSARIALNSSVVSFHYGIQAGDGGFELSNSSNIVGNVFATGPIIGNNNNSIYGSVVSSGPDGLVYGIHATSSVYAHTIGDVKAGTIIDGDAYFQTLTNTSVAGVQYPNSPDQPSAPLPISDAQIAQWEGYAQDGGTITSCDNQGNYTVSSDQALGPVKIECNLIIKSSSAVLTVTGPIWVTGNITMQTGPTISMDPNLGSQNVAIIADNPSDPTGSGIITVGQSTQFDNSGTPGSFVFLISQNSSAESGGTTVAISLNQSSSALVAYASHGLADLSQSVALKEVTAYKISLSQSASVTYDTGLPSTVFQTGPGGSWTFVPSTYAMFP